MSQNKLRVIISGGGTGGHIFPAIAIANAIRKENPDADILFVGAKGRMEMEKVPEAGYNIIGLKISGLQRKLSFRNVIFPFKVISSLINAGKIIKQFKPDIVVGVGGYASGPVLRIATRRRIPTVIQEQNSYPGITNKILSKRVNCICVAYEGMEKYFPENKIVLTGNPVRSDIAELSGKREEGLKFFGLNSEKKTVLIIGGSLGARTINESIVSELEFFHKNNVQLIWQTGKHYYEIALKACENMKDDGITPYSFISRMDLAYSVADVIISRAGAIAISELCLVGKPVILVPSPNVSEDHQTKNAMALTKNNAAILVKDVEAREKLGKTVYDLLKDEKQCALLKNNIVGYAHFNAAEKIAHIITNLVNRN